MDNIEPTIFTEIRYLSTWWYGSATGDYPNCSASGEQTVWIEDAVTGDILDRKYCGDRGGSYKTFDISSYTNPINLKATITWQKDNNGDATGEGWISTVYLKIKE